MASPMDVRTGGVISELLERSRLLVADLGVTGGSADAVERKVEKYSPEPSLTGLRMGGGV